jgi:hypothetical protein
MRKYGERKHQGLGKSCFFPKQLHFDGAVA